MNRLTGWRLMIVCAGLLLGGCSNGTPALVDIAQVPIPTKDEIASAPTVPICSVAGRSPRHVGELVRMKGNLSFVDGKFVLLGAECRTPLFVMFDGEVAHTRDFGEFVSEISTRLKYRPEATVVGRVHWSRNGYIRSDRSTLRHPGAMLSIHALESVQEPRPTAEQILQAPTMSFCVIADADARLDGQLVRVKGMHSVVGFHNPFLASPSNEDCGEPLSLSFDEKADLRDGFHALDDSFRDVTMVARVDLHRTWTNGPFRVTLKVFAVESVEPRN